VSFLGLRRAEPLRFPCDWEWQFVSLISPNAFLILNLTTWTSAMENAASNNYNAIAVAKSPNFIQESQDCVLIDFMVIGFILHSRTITFMQIQMLSKWTLRANALNKLMSCNRIPFSWNSNFTCVLELWWSRYFLCYLS
jgi:hypothetical protein